MEDKNKPAQINISIELPEEVAEGVYSNLALISNSNSEFIIDFIRIIPVAQAVPKAKVKSRILLTPQHAKRLLRALKENIAKYESINGTIEDNEVNALPLNFGGPTAQA